VFSAPAAIYDAAITVRNNTSARSSPLQEGKERPGLAAVRHSTSVRNDSRTADKISTSVQSLTFVDSFQLSLKSHRTVTAYINLCTPSVLKRETLTAAANKRVFYSWPVTLKKLHCACLYLATGFSSVTRHQAIKKSYKHENAVRYTKRISSLCQEYDINVAYVRDKRYIVCVCVCVCVCIYIYIYIRPKQTVTHWTKC
jgi:hypothetical protein